MELKLLALLKGINSIAIDTSPFIYYIEEHEDYIGVIDPLFTPLETPPFMAGMIKINNTHPSGP